MAMYVESSQEQGFPGAPVRNCYRRSRGNPRVNDNSGRVICVGNLATLIAIGFGTHNVLILEYGLIPVWSPSRRTCRYAGVASERQMAIYALPRFGLMFGISAWPSKRKTAGRLARSLGRIQIGQYIFNVRPRLGARGGISAVTNGKEWRTPQNPPDAQRHDRKKHGRRIGAEPRKTAILFSLRISLLKKPPKFRMPTRARQIDGPSYPA